MSVFGNDSFLSKKQASRNDKARYYRTYRHPHIQFPEQTLGTIAEDPAPIGNIGDGNDYETIYIEKYRDVTRLNVNTNTEVTISFGPNGKNLKEQRKGSMTFKKLLLFIVILSMPFVIMYTSDALYEILPRILSNSSNTNEEAMSPKKPVQLTFARERFPQMDKFKLNRLRLLLKELNSSSVDSFDSKLLWNKNRHTSIFSKEELQERQSKLHKQHITYTNIRKELVLKKLRQTLVKKAMFKAT